MFDKDFFGKCVQMLNEKWVTVLPTTLSIEVYYIKIYFGRDLFLKMSPGTRIPENQEEKFPN